MLNFLKWRPLTTAMESSKQMKDRNNSLADANFVIASGSQILETLIQSNSTAMKVSPLETGPRL
jgi:hypothetical protein